MGDETLPLADVASFEETQEVPVPEDVSDLAAIEEGGGRVEPVRATTSARIRARRVRVDITYELQRLGLAIVLARRGGGRVELVVERADGVGGGALVGDALVAVEGVAVFPPREEDFTAFVAAVVARPRPLRLSFERVVYAAAAAPRARRPTPAQRVYDDKSLAAFERWAAEGDGKACFNASMMRANGVGCEPDLAAALLLLRKAASLGVQRAHANLAVLYAAGRGGVERDDDETYRWQCEAAKDGDDPEALYRLGVLLSLGVGCERDDSEAMWCWTRAAAAGHALAKEQVQTMVVRTAAPQRSVSREVWEAAFGAPQSDALDEGFAEPMLLEEAARSADAENPPTPTPPSTNPFAD